MLKLVVPFVALITVGVLPAVSQDKPALPVISIQQVDAENADVYAMLIAKSNANIKEKAGVENFMQVFQGMAAGEHSGALFVVSAGPSFAELSKIGTTMASDPSGVRLRGSFGAVRTLGPRSVWKAIRFDGGRDGAWVYNVFMNVKDEAAYLTALNEFKAICDGLGFQDIYLNAYRVMAGSVDSSNSTHFVSANAPSSDRLAALVDAIFTEPTIRAWVAKAAPLRTVHWAGIYGEIGK